MILSEYGEYGRFRYIFRLANEMVLGLFFTMKREANARHKNTGEDSDLDFKPNANSWTHIC